MNSHINETQNRNSGKRFAKGVKTLLGSFLTEFMSSKRKKKGGRASGRNVGQRPAAVTSEVSELRDTCARDVTSRPADRRASRLVSCFNRNSGLLPHHSYSSLLINE